MAAGTMTDPVSVIPDPPVDRRQMLRAFGWSGIALFAAGSLAGSCRMFFPRTVFEPPSRFKAGAPDEYAPGTVSAKFQEAHRVWIVRRSDGRFLALKAECTHLGCTPEWLPSQAKFKCPCHGSGFRMGGLNFEGPAPRPLDRVKIALGADGQLAVDKGVTYSGTPGQDSDTLYPQSLLTV